MAERHPSMTRPVSDSDLCKARFDGHWIAWTQDGVDRIPAPAWLDWPHHSAAEMGPPIQSSAELAAQSKAKRK